MMVVWVGWNSTDGDDDGVGDVIGQMGMMMVWVRWNSTGEDDGVGEME